MGARCARSGPRGSRSALPGTQRRAARCALGRRLLVSLYDAQQTVDRWIGQYTEGYFAPLTNLARLTEEVGELAREINHRFGEKTKKKEEAGGALGMEAAEIL